MPPRSLSPDQKEKALAFIRRATRPVLIGEVAMSFGYNVSVEMAETTLEAMVHEGTLRYATPAECKRWDVQLAVVAVPISV